MANMRETDGPLTGTFESHRTFVAPGRTLVTLRFDAVDCVINR